MLARYYRWAKWRITLFYTQARSCKYTNNHIEAKWDSLRKKQLYQQLLNKSINIFDQLKEKEDKANGGNYYNLIPNRKCKQEMINKLKLKYDVVENTVYLQLYQLIDSGAESNYLSPQVLACFNPETLFEKKNNIKSSDSSVRPADDTFIVKFVNTKGNFINTSVKENTALAV